MLTLGLSSHQLLHSLWSLDPVMVVWEDCRPLRCFSRNTRAGGKAQSVECLPYIHSAAGSSPSINWTRCHRPVAPILGRWRQKRKKVKFIRHLMELEATRSEGRWSLILPLLLKMLCGPTDTLWV